MKNRGLIIGTLVLFAFVVTSATFAFWAASVTGAEDTATGTVTIGEGDTVTTEVNVADVTDTGPLVPVGQTGITSTAIELDVEWTGDGAEGATGTLSVEQTSIEISTGSSVVLSGAAVEAMFTVELPTDSAITAGTSQIVTINVIFENEPKDKETYDLVANGELIITFEFSVKTEDGLD